jgi:hypothetical protein
MTTYRVPFGEQTLTTNINKSWTAGTSSLFEITGGPIIIYTLYGVVTTAVPSADINYRMFHSNSIGGNNPYSAQADTFFGAQPIGQILSFPAGVGSAPGFGQRCRPNQAMATKLCTTGRINFASNNGTPAMSWYLHWAPMSVSSSVTAL